jgi:hypothetical protein
MIINIVVSRNIQKGMVLFFIQFINLQTHISKINQIAHKLASQKMNLKIKEKN